MSFVFADTWFFIGLVDRDDEHHARATEFLRGNRTPLLTTSAITLELGAFFYDARLRRYFLACITTVQNAKVRIVHVDAALQQRGIDLFALRPDKDWSLADCISFVVMEDQKIGEAATTDRHFEEAGFVALLRKAPQS